MAIVVAHGYQSATIRAAIAILWIASAAVKAPAEPLFRGEGVRHWLRALTDLDPSYRATAAHALGHFGSDVVPHLSRGLRTDPDPDVRLACGRALVTLGDAGQQAVGAAFADPDMTVRRRVITVVARLADRGHAFAPHLRTAANVGETALPALEALAALGMGLPGEWPGADIDAEGSPSSETPLHVDRTDCFIADRFSRFRVSVRDIDPAAVRSARLFFRTQGDEWYYVGLDTLSQTSADSSEFSGWLPKPAAGMIPVISWFARVDTETDSWHTETVHAAILASHDACRQAGLRPVETGTPPGGEVRIFQWKGPRPR